MESGTPEPRTLRVPHFLFPHFFSSFQGFPGAPGPAAAFRSLRDCVAAYSLYRKVLLSITRRERKYAAHGMVAADAPPLATEVPPANQDLPASAQDGAGAAPPGAGGGVPPADPKVLMVTACVKAVHLVCVRAACPEGTVPDIDDPSQKLLWPKLEVSRELAREKSGYSHEFLGTNAHKKPSAHFFSNITNWIKQFEGRRDAIRPAEVKLRRLRAEEAEHATELTADQPPRRPLLEIQAELVAARSALTKAQANVEKWRWGPHLASLFFPCTRY